MDEAGGSGVAIEGENDGKDIAGMALIWRLSVGRDAASCEGD